MRQKFKNFVYDEEKRRVPMHWIIVGLGNPGKSYEDHRHNVGFQTLNVLHKVFHFPPFQHKENFSLAQTHLFGHKVMVCCPMTYMNLSGQAIAPLVSLYKQARWVVIHDELDIACGQVRFKRSGGTGGHNGLKSLHGIIGSEYERIRIGIGRPLFKTQVSSFVLSPFTSQEKPIISQAMEHITKTLPLLLQGQEDLFIQQLHSFCPLLQPSH
jgi:PTH1 family peptidyl-tRNA hydrolase